MNDPKEFYDPNEWKIWVAFWVCVAVCCMAIAGCRGYVTVKALELEHKHKVEAKP